MSKAATLVIGVEAHALSIWDGKRDHMCHSLDEFTKTLRKLADEDTICMCSSSWDECEEYTEEQWILDYIERKEAEA